MEKDGNDLVLLLPPRRVGERAGLARPRIYRLAAGRFTDAVAIDLGAGFSGEGFAPALRGGQAGVIMGPLDNGVNRADDVRLPVIDKKKKK